LITDVRFASGGFLDEIGAHARRRTAADVAAR
jgi:hypothetical protein